MNNLRYQLVGFGFMNWILYITASLLIFRNLFFSPLAPTLEHRADFSVSWSFLQTVGLLGRGISQSQGRYLNTGQHKHRINTYTHQTSMHFVEFEPTNPASERAKTVHSLDHSATVTGLEIATFLKLWININLSDFSINGESVNRNYTYLTYTSWWIIILSTILYGWKTQSPTKR
jgi:hypothetical protein